MPAVHPDEAALAHSDSGKPARPQTVSFLNYIPVINMGYDMFFTRTPSFDQFEKFTATLVLIDALVLALAATFPTGWDAEELSNWDELKNFDGSYTNDTPPSYVLGYACGYSVMALGFSTVSAVICYMFASTTDMEEDWVAVEIWKTLKWVMFINTFFSIWGVMWACASFAYLFQIKFPDYSHPSFLNSVPDNWRDETYVADSVDTMGNICFGFSVVVPIVACSTAIIFKARKASQRLAQGLSI